MLIAISVPADNERGAQYMEQVLDALHSRNRWCHRISLEIGRHTEEVVLFCRVPQSLLPSVQRQLHAAYPDCRIESLAKEPPTQQRLCHRRLRLRLRPMFGAIRCWDQFADREQRTVADPVAGILNMIDDESVETRVVLQARPVPVWIHRRLWKEFIGTEHEAKLDRSLFLTSLTIHAWSEKNQQSRTKEKLRDIAAAFGRFVGGPVDFKRAWILRWSAFSTPELATLWHPATLLVRTQKLSTVTSRQLEPPVNIASMENEPGLAVLGRVAFQQQSDVFGIRPDDRRRHLAVIGKTGMGKSTLLRNLIVSDIEAGRGAGLIDPHGDLAEDVAAAVPASRTNDVLYFDAGDRAHPIAFNPLACHSPQEQPLVVSGIVATFKKLYGDSWGPRLEHILRNALLTLVEQPNTSLVSLLRLLADTAYRKQLVGRTSDPVVRSFWQQEFQQWRPQLQAEAVAPIQNKVGQFISNPVLRAIIGQSRDRLQIRNVMNSQQVLIVNLSKGRSGDDASTMLGSLLVTQLQLAAMSRADMPERDRQDFFAYVDEFQNFATESFATILSEARKYRLSLTLANQYLDQMDEPIRHAVFGNVGSLLAFQVGARDAETLAEQFGGGLLPSDLMALPRYTAYARLLIDGMPSRPFSMETLPPREGTQDSRLAVIRKTSRHRYGKPCRTVSEEIERAMTA